MRSLVRTVGVLIAALLTISISASLVAREPVQPPKVDEDKPLKEVRSFDGFRYFSGKAETFHNHPAIFAGGADEKIVVIGKDCEEEFPIAKLDDAVKRYKQLLKDRGYHP